MKQIILKYFVTAVCSCLFINEIMAQPSDVTAGKLYGYAGVTFGKVQTSAYFETPYPEINRTISLEDDLLFESSPSLFYVKVLAGGRFQFVASYMSLHRSSVAVLERKFAIGDSIYDVGARISGYFNTDYLSGSVRYSILRTDRFTAGLTLGVRYLKYDAGITAESSGYNLTRAEKFDVPIPVPGIHASFYPVSSLLLRGSLDYFKLKVSETTGEVLELNLSAEYYIIKNLGAGIGYMKNYIHVTGIPENDLYLRDVKFDVGGMNVFVAVRI